MEHLVMILLIQMWIINQVIDSVFPLVWYHSFYFIFVELCLIFCQLHLSNVNINLLLSYVYELIPYCSRTNSFCLFFASFFIYVFLYSISKTFSISFDLQISYKTQQNFQHQNFQKSWFQDLKINHKWQRFQLWWLFYYFGTFDEMMVFILIKS